MYFDYLGNGPQLCLHTGMWTGCASKWLSWDRNYNSMDRCPSCSWKMKNAIIWIDAVGRSLKQGCPLPSLSKPVAIAWAVLDEVCADEISTELIGIIILYLNDRRNFSSTVTTPLDGIWGLNLLPIWRCPLAFLGTLSIWHRLEQGPFPSPSSADLSSVRQMSRVSWASGKYSTCPSPNTGGFGLDLWVSHRRERKRKREREILLVVQNCCCQ
jgi:hypothetical protein